MIEAAFACVLFSLIFLAMIQVFTMVRANIYIKTIAREGAREASLSMDINSGKAKANDYNTQYFGETAGLTAVEVYTQSDSTGKVVNVICSVHRPEKMFRVLSNEGVGVINFEASAIYPWWQG